MDRHGAAKVAAVTGCCGRLGRACANALVEDGWTVRGVDRSDRARALHPSIDFHQGGLDDIAVLEKAFHGADAVVHLAACPDDADLETVLVPSNVIGVSNVCDACTRCGVQTLLLASSGKVHAGHRGALPIKTTDAVSVVCKYGASKLFAEGAAQAFVHSAAPPDPSGGGSQGPPPSSTGPRRLCVVVRFAWAPRTPEDVAAMRARAEEAGQGADEFLSPSDAGRFAVAALRNPNGLSGYHLFFCQSVPPPGRPARFDLRDAADKLGWAPRDTFPADIEALCASDDYTPDARLFPRVAS